MPGEMIVIQFRRIRTAGDGVVVVSAFAVRASEGHGGLLTTYRVARHEVGAVYELGVLAPQFVVFAL